jgi:hypothetical protein
MNFNPKRAAMVAAGMLLASVLMGATGGFPSRPTFQMTTSVFDGTGGTATAPQAGVVAKSPAPTMIWDETDQGADGKMWRIRANTGGFDIQTLDDSVSTARSVMNVTRTAAAVTAVNFGNATDNPPYTFLGSAAVSGSNFVATKSVVADGTGNPYSINVTSTNPYLGFDETDNGVNARVWELGVSAGNLTGRVSSDAGSVQNWLSVTRTNAAVTSVTFGNATDNPTYATLGTGALAVAGNITSAGVSVCRSDGTNCPATTSSGNFTVSYDNACTTTPTITFGYVQNGNVVVMSVKSSSGFSCTADSTAFTATTATVPAGIRPTGNARESGVFTGCVDNSVQVGCDFTVTAAGTVDIARVTVALLQDQAWTAAGSRSGPPNGLTFTYYLTNP